MRLELKDKKVLVLGLGETGLSALRWLHSQGALVSVADTRLAPPNIELLKSELPHVAVHLGPYHAKTFADCELVVASPGIAVNGPMADPAIRAAIAKGIKVIGDIEL